MQKPDQSNMFLFDDNSQIKPSDLVEQFHTGLLLLKTNGIIYQVNRKVLKLIHKDPQEIVGSNFTHFIHPNDVKTFNETIQKVNVSSTPEIVEIRIRKSENDYYPALILINLESINELNEKFYFLTVIDFTIHKMKAEFIKYNETRFEHMANSAPVMIWIADVEGLFSFVNKIWLDYTGEKIGEQLGMNWIKNVHQNDLQKFLDTYQNAFRSKSPFTFEFRFKNKDNNYEWMIMNGTPRLNNENIFMGFIGSCTNINAQKIFEDKMKKVNNELVELNNAKDKFFSIISHDLRNPLGALVGLLGIIEEEDLEEEQRKNLISEAALASKLALGLMENLLEWSRMQAGKIPFEPEELDLLTLIREQKYLYTQNLKIKNISIEEIIDDNVSVFADLKMTETIIRNLISNAIKYSKPNGVITISAQKANEMIAIKVIDNGVGIPEADISKLFRIDINYTTKGTLKEMGTGLGLILCKELVEKQGGKINVTSKINSGSTFIFTLPSAGSSL